MLQTRIYLECDDCKRPFPAFSGQPAPLDGAFHSKRQLLAGARKLGWSRYADHDYCPAHEINHRHEARAGKGI
jgi:hypothetical protein